MRTIHPREDPTFVPATAPDAPEPAAHRSDPALVAACLAGDERAWQEVIDRYGRLVLSIPRRMGMAPADAEDVFQNVFAILFRSLPSLQDQTRLSAWLITTTRRESWRVSNRVKPTDELDETLAAVSDEPVADVARLEREQAVREAMARLDPRCRRLLTALFLDPEPSGYTEIAAELGMAMGSIGPTRARCFRKLEPILRELGVDEEDG